MFDEILENVGKDWGGNKGFEYGTHEVIILMAEAKTDNKNREIVKISVGGKEDTEKEGETTFWFHSEGGAKMAVQKTLGLLVHNVSEDKKDNVRELGKKLFGGINDISKSRDIVVKLINEKLIGKEGYFVVNPTGTYKTSRYGDLWPYPAEPAKRDDNEVVPLNGQDITNSVDASEIPDFGV